MNYQEELKRLQENEALNAGEYWKPEAGQHKAKALSEIENGNPYEEEGKEPQLRQQIHLLVNGKEVLWTMPFGLTPASTYGQLVHLASVRGNKLKDETFTIVVTGSGKTRRFTIVA
jgi:hypothetical protein